MGYSEKVGSRIGNRIKVATIKGMSKVKDKIQKAKIDRTKVKMYNSAQDNEELQTLVIDKQGQGTKFLPFKTSEAKS